MNGSMIATLGPLVLLLVVMYFLLIRPQKKREKQINEMRRSINVGDEVITIGGICGKVVKTKDDSLILQVGADKVKFEVMRWSISKVVEPAGKGSTGRAKADAQEEEAPAPRKVKPKRLQKASAAEVEETKEEVPAAETAADATEDASAEETPAAESEAPAEEEK